MTSPHIRQAQAALAAGRPDAALAALGHAPADREALTLRAGLLMHLRRLDDADSAFADLLRRHPDDSRGLVNHGHLLKALGRTAEAVAAYRRASEVAAAPGIAWWSLANLKSVPLDAEDVAAMRAALGRADGDDDRLHLHFALGKALDDARDPSGAIEHLHAGNAVHWARAPYRAAAASAGFRQAEAAFTPALVAARAGAGASEADPIFIVGMPRSGSTLVEQILASHPLVEGTEELHVLHQVAREAGGYGALPGLPPAALRALGERYLALARRHRTTGRPFFTDKMPSNWVYAGLIRLILPNARIIDVRRHPMAGGFGNYAQHFHRGNDFAYDLDAIGRFTADYVRHMAHVDRVAPGAIHRIRHEALVDNPEGEVRRLLATLGLPFDPACLSFHATARAVHTPSADQVRRPINRDGIDRWRAYAPWLDPLAHALGPVLEHHPADPPGW